MKPTQKTRAEKSDAPHWVFFDMSDIILGWLVTPGVTVNGDYYRFVLKDKLRLATRTKDPLCLKKASSCIMTTRMFPSPEL